MDYGYFDQYEMFMNYGFLPSAPPHINEETGEVKLLPFNVMHTLSTIVKAPEEIFSKEIPYGDQKDMVLPYMFRQQAFKLRYDFTMDGFKYMLQFARFIVFDEPDDTAVK